MTIDRILSKAVDGTRLTPEEGVALFASRDLHKLGRAAHAVTMRLHPKPYRTFNIDRNINYTNICAAVCDFCAFYRKSSDAEAYVLPREEMYQKIEETIALGGDQILMQGGMHPSLKLEWYEELLRALRARFPSINLHAFSPPEIWHFHKINKLPLETVLRRLKEAGLGSLPGGGGEILVDRVRKELTKGKALTGEWLEVCRVWHKLGGKGTCTMMFGHIETDAERIEHLTRLRDLQDETHGFTAFICWTMQPGQKMANFPEAGAFEYLRTQAIARLYLDNIPNIQSSWVTQGGKIGQIALFFGANDMGSLMIEENVVASAGTVHYLTLEEIKRSIREAGWEPRQRNVFYQLIEERAPISSQAETRERVAGPQLTRHNDPTAELVEFAFDGMGMADDFEMRMRLQQVAAYRDLCRRVRRSGRKNIVFASIMLFLAYVVWQGQPNRTVLILYLILALGELLVGLFKWLAPSAEGVFLDGVVLLVFAAYNFGMEYWRFQRGMPFSPIIIFLGLFMLMGAIGRFKDYRVLRQLFAERPSPEHLAWFNDLTREIKTADPQSDELALDLPTSPHWKVKLLGSMAFFTTTRGDLVLVSGSDDFEIRREKVDHGTGRRKAILRIHDVPYPEFEITDATWANYQNWRAANPLPQSPPSAVGGPG